MRQFLWVLTRYMIWLKNKKQFSTAPDLHFMMHWPLFLFLFCSLVSTYESSKFPKSWTFETPILKPAVCPLNILNFKFKWLIALRLKINQRSYYDLSNSAFWGWLSVESQPQNPEFRNNPENFHPSESHWYCYSGLLSESILQGLKTKFQAPVLLHTMSGNEAVKLSC